MSTFTDLVVSFQRALKATQLYGIGHPRHAEALADLEASYGTLLQGRDYLQIATGSDRLFVEGYMEDPDNLQVKTLAHELEDRDVFALLLFPDPPRAELEALLSVLAQNPARLRAQGGTKRLLEARRVRHIRVVATRLEDVPEADELAQAALDSVLEPPPKAPIRPPDAPPPGPRPGPPPAHPAALPPPDQVAHLKEHLASLTAGPGLPDVSALGGFLETLGLDGQVATPEALGILSQALGALEPERLLAVFRGVVQLRPGPMREVLARFAEDLAPRSLATAFAHSVLTLDRCVELSESVKPLVLPPDRWLSLLGKALRKAGAPALKAEILLSMAAWSDLPLETRIAHLSDGQRILEIPAGRVPGFLRELLDAGRIPPFNRLLRHHALGLSAPALATRIATGEDFEAIARWLPDLPVEALDLFGEILAKACAREPDPSLHGRLARLAEQLLQHWLDQGDAARAHPLAAALQSTDPARAQVAVGILARLGSPARVDRLLDRLHHLDARTLEGHALPLLKRLGPAVGERVAERLATEPSRARRKLLAQVLRQGGWGDEAALLADLDSRDAPRLRRALLAAPDVLERTPDPTPFLRHKDPAVAAAALVALGRTGGPEAGQVLAEFLSSKDPGLRLQALAMLGEREDPQALPALANLLRPGKGRPEDGLFRERASALLGRLGSGTAVSLLEGLLARHRGLFSDSREPLPVRIAALRALFRLETMEAQAAIGRILDAEPGGPEREALQAALTAAIQGEGD